MPLDRRIDRRYRRQVGTAFIMLNDPGLFAEANLKVSGVDATRDGTREYMASAKPILERGICRNPDVPVLGKLGVTLLYHYTAGRQSLVRLNIAPDQCVRK